jgi:hypothetical protein
LSVVGLTGLLVGDGPAGQQGERVGGRGGGFGGVDEQFPAWVGGEVGALELQVEPADEGMTVMSGAGICARFR